MLNWFRKAEPVAPVRVPVLREEEKAVITIFAKGDDNMLQHALAVYRRNVTRGAAIRETDHMRFMSEIASSAPDLALRSHYRRRILGQA